jgi:hypothetical protein
MTDIVKPSGRHIVMLLAITAANQAEATDRLVPQQYASIQGAINAAANGDMVLVSPGKYLELLDIGSKRITVRGVAGAETTVVDATFLGVALRIGSGATRQTRIEGLTISNGRSTNSAGGIVVEGGAPTIVDNIIRGNLGISNGHGVTLIDSAARLERNLITQNRSVDTVSGGGGGAGIGITGGACPPPSCAGAEIVDNQIIDNRANRFSSGGGLYITGGGVVSIVGNVISGNQSQFSGGGIQVDGFVQVRIENNLIMGNRAFQGAAINARASDVRIIGNTIIRNAVGANASEMHLDLFTGASLLLANNIVVGDGLATLVQCPTPSPLLRHNNLYNPGGTVSTGSCAGTVGNNGNVSEPPMFAADGFSLSGGSPMIDRADSALSTTPIDLLGAPRILDGNGDGVAVVDMGAVEYDDRLFGGGFEQD